MRYKIPNSLVQSLATTLVLFFVGVFGYMCIEKFTLIEAMDNRDDL